MLYTWLWVTIPSTLKDHAETQHDQVHTQKFYNEEIAIVTVERLIALYPLLFLVSHSCLEGTVREKFLSTSMLSTSTPC